MAAEKVKEIGVKKEIYGPGSPEGKWVSKRLDKTLKTGSNDNLGKEMIRLENK